MGVRNMRALSIVAAALVVLSGPAAAENSWRLASDSAEGDMRFLVDISQLDHYVNPNGKQLFGLPLRAVSNGVVKDGYVAIDARSCVVDGGDMIMTIGDASQRFWWAVDGKRMYDAVGLSVCNVAAAMYEAAQGGSAEATGIQRADKAAGTGISHQ